MTDVRTLCTASAISAIAELLRPGEVTAINLSFDNETLDVKLSGPVFEQGSYEFIFDWLFEWDAPQIAKAAFDYLQEYLAENGSTRGQARPECKAGHKHPAFCQLVPDGLVISCPVDFEQIRRIA